MIWMLPGIVAGFLALTGGILIRKGQRGGGTLFMVAGVVARACYGVVVNVVPWHFSRLMCAYIASFTLITRSWRQFVLGQELPKVIWLGVAIVVTGGLVVVLSGDSGHPAQTRCNQILARFFWSNHPEKHWVVLRL